MVRPETRIGVPDPLLDCVAPPFVDTHVAAYAVIAAPLVAPAVNETLSWLAAEAVATPMVGAAGTFAAITLDDTDDATDVPAAFVAMTEHVYAFVAVNPVTTIGDDTPVAEPVAPPLFDTQLAE